MTAHETHHEPIRDTFGEHSLTCTQREDGYYDVVIRRAKVVLSFGIVEGYRVWNVVAHWQDWIEEGTFRPTYLRHQFSPREGRLAFAAGQPFVYRGRDPENDYLYLIDVWLGGGFIRRVQACHDEIFHDNRETSSRAA